MRKKIQGSDLGLYSRFEQLSILLFLFVSVVCLCLASWLLRVHLSLQVAVVEAAEVSDAVAEACVGGVADEEATHGSLRR